jgi:signal transduction histidine kinase
MVLDMHGQILLMDGRGLLSVGRAPGELVGTSIFDRLEGNPAAQEAVQRALKGQEMHVEFQSEQGPIYETFLLPYYDASDEQEGVIVLSLDVTQRKQMEADLEEIKHMLMASVENERARLAQQLHDGPLQDLYGVFYQVQEVKDHLPFEAQDTLDTALETIRSVNSTLRFICGELRPTTLAHLGLRMAIRSHSERLQERYPLTIHLDLEEDAQQLDANQRLPLYRIYQVLISNVVRHANARHAWVRLRLQPERVLLEVQDNGQGFEKPANWVELVRKGHFGLTGAQERAEALGGTLEILSQPGGGTLARVNVPRTIE